MARKVLLICGILASLVYVGVDILVGILYEGYSFIDQAVSELFAIGTPTSHLVVSLFSLSSTLLVAFAVGVWLSSGRSRALRVMALTIVGNAANSLVLWNFFPMHMRGAEPTFTDTMHAILAINPFVLLSIGLAVVAFRNWFRFYSIGTILILVMPAIFAFSYVGNLVANQPTPWLGLAERISQYGNQLWQVVLAIVLLRAQDTKRRTDPGAQTRETLNFLQILKAGVIYFLVIFGAGFVLGPIRILWAVPRFGTRMAELMETPIMLVVTILAARWIVRHLVLPPTASIRLGMGCIALVLMLLGKFTLMLWLRGLSISNYLASRDPVSGTIYYVMLGIFAAMPILVVRRDDTKKEI